MLNIEEMKSLGMTDEQINGVINGYKSNVIDFTVKESDITTVEQIKEYAKGKIVELPPFAEGQRFIARIKRPSLLALVKSGKIPNSLLNQATELFKQGAGSLGEDNTVSDLFVIIEAICESALISPSYKEIKDAGLELNDEQMMAIFSYTQQGVKALEQFR